MHQMKGKVTFSLHISLTSRAACAIMNMQRRGDVGCGSHSGEPQHITSGGKGFPPFLFLRAQRARRNKNGEPPLISRAQTEEQLYKMPRFALFVRRAADSARDVRAEGCARFLGPEALARRRVRTGQNVHFVSGATAPRHRARRIKSDRG